MKNYLKFTLTIFVILLTSRLIPHPPNFTCLIALSFYVPKLIGRKFVPALIFCFLISDLILGFHNVLFFTWGSIYLISLTVNLFPNNGISRICGSLLGAIIFFLFTNLGVWISGSYGYTLNGLLSCYILAIPFFANTIISTLIYASIFEFFFKQKNLIAKIV